MHTRQGSSVNERRLSVEVGSIALSGLGAFTLISLLTFNPSDPSLFTVTKEAAQNACGAAGAWIADFCLQIFGIGSFLLPALFVFLAVAMHRREGSARLIATLGAMATAVASLGVFLSIHWKTWSFGGATLLTGGALGAWVSEGLIRSLNLTGASILSASLFFVAIALATPVSVAQLMGRAIWAVMRASYFLVRYVGSYLLYLTGMLLMRGGSKLGVGLTLMTESAVKLAKERMAKRVLTAMKDVKSEVVAAPQIGAEGNESSNEKSAEASDGDADEKPTLTLEPVEGSTAPSVEIPPPPEPALKSASVRGGTETEPKIVPFETSTEAPDPSKVEAALKRLKSPRRAKSNWKLPITEFLAKVPKVESQFDRDKLIENSRVMEQKLKEYGIEGRVEKVNPGPVITLYEFLPGSGVKVSKIQSLADDLSMALSAKSVRVIGQIPGKNVVGIEVPSEKRDKVFFREFIDSAQFKSTNHILPVAIGKDIAGNIQIADLAKMPHLLVAGQTGSGKSVFMNGLICSLLYRFTPDEMRLILVDPKFLEFAAYQSLPHLLLPLVTEPQQASTALKWAVREMDRRYRLMSRMGVKNLSGFNAKIDEMGVDVVRDLLLSEENQAEEETSFGAGEDWIECFEHDEAGAPRVAKLPFIVIVIDELADLMMLAKKDVEVSIARIAQKARAAGIHLVIATQRPSTDVITGLIKANLPSRISFQLSSFIDSKTILNWGGAERLLGYGDMLFMSPGSANLVRMQGAYLDENEIEKVTNFLRAQGKPEYRNEILLEDEAQDEDGDSSEQDPLFEEAVLIAKDAGQVSASFLQRKLKVGYNRASRIVETMEERGMVGPADGARPREVLLR